MNDKKQEKCKHSEIEAQFFSERFGQWGNSGYKYVCKSCGKVLSGEEIEKGYNKKRNNYEA